jgi:hypothetical protein
MSYYLDIDGTEIAWQGGGDLTPTLKKWIADGDVTEHLSRDGTQTVVVNWRQVGTVRLDEHGGPLFSTFGGGAA